MGILAYLFIALAFICGIVSLVCFVMVLIQMFGHGESTMGIVCIVLFFCGVGGLVTFIYGWIKAGEWHIKNLMLAWTGAIVGGFVFYGLAAAFGFAAMGNMGGNM